MEESEQLQGTEESNGLVEDVDEIENKEDSPSRNRCCSWFSKIHITIEPALFAIFLSANLSEVVITNLIMARVCEVELHFNETECDLLGSDTEEGHRIESMVQPYASILITGKSLVMSILPAIVSLFWGPWSDYNGRKLLLLLPMLGLSLTYSLYAGLSYITHLRPVYFLLASLPFAFFGGYINLISAAYSYISDISTEESRAMRLGFVEGSLYVGELVGIISSYQSYSINQKYGYIITCSISALISLAAFLYTVIFVQESIRRNEMSQETKSVFQLKFVKEIFNTCFKRRENYGRIIIILSLFAMTTTIIAMEGEGNLMYLFTRLRFGWDLQQFTTWYSVSIATSFFGLIVGCVVLTKIFKITDAALVAFSYLMKFVVCISYVFIPSKSSYLMYWLQLIGFLGSVSGPALRAVLSKIVPQEDVGKVFFLATSFESLFPLVFAPLYTALYNATLRVLPGAFFILSGSFFFIDFIISCFTYFVQRRTLLSSYSRIESE